MPASTPRQTDAAPLTRSRRTPLAPRKGPRRALPDLPEHYYRTNFLALLGDARKRCGGLIGDAGTAFVSDFRELSFEAQCLYARMAGRKGRVFDMSKLVYPEIGPLMGPQGELESAGFARSCEERDRADLLQALTRAQLADRLLAADTDGVIRKSWSKSKLLNAHNLASTAQLAGNQPLLVQGRAETFGFLLYLYFGRAGVGLEAFTLRDLGLRRAAEGRQRTAPLFETASAARSAYWFEAALLRMDALGRIGVPESDDWPEAEGERAQEVRDRLAARYGQACERGGETDAAEAAYRLGDGAHCRERLVRLLWKSGGRDEATSLLARMNDNPATSDEALFAEDFTRRKLLRKRTSLLTDMLRAAPVIRLDEAYRDAPEWGSVLHYRAKGMEAHRTENGVWNALFGLAFWDLLFEGETTAYVSEFDRRPALLRSGRFHQACEAAIERRIAMAGDTSRFQLHLSAMALKAADHPENGVFAPGPLTLRQVQALVGTAPPPALQAILRAQACDPKGMRDGWPDIMVAGPDGLQFLEIKAEGDTLRRNQMARISQLAEAGFDAGIRAVEWIVDPGQPYVVVDVETTGGRAHAHRITEIGAVRVVRGEVTDTFQTLLNPERPIPLQIIKLTGITDEMVSDAPLFAEQADAFERFMNGAIFVAHNASFDYGFIRAEFERLGRRFRYPRLCTVAAMRRHYPGHSSYGLKNLTRQFGIPLDSHHRALCDAKAAAGLLALINEKRMA